jgi:hypothetical protein
MKVLRNVANRGHTVVCTFGEQELDRNVFDRLDSIALLSVGRVIYTGSCVGAKTYFCSDELGYIMQENVELVDFLLDIASGTERPAGRLFTTFKKNIKTNKPF